MALNHGVYVSEQETSVSTPIVATSGVPFVIGAAPVQSAESPAAAGKPVMAISWGEAVKKLGYSDDWEAYPLCEFMYSHFQLFGCQPVIFCNILDPSSMKESVAAADIAVADHKAMLPIEAIDDATLVVKAAGGTGDAYARVANAAKNALSISGNITGYAILTRQERGLRLRRHGGASDRQRGQRGRGRESCRAGRRGAVRIG